MQIKAHLSSPGLEELNEVIHIVKWAENLAKK
jgi:hypothetical protein